MPLSNKWIAMEAGACAGLFLVNMQSGTVITVERDLEPHVLLL